MIDRAALKLEAKDVLRGALVSPYLFTLLCLAVSLVMNGIDEYTSLPARIADLAQVDPQLVLGLPPFLRNASFPRLPAMFIDVLSLLLTVTLGAGASLYHLGIRRGEEMPYSTLFDGFGMVGRVVALGLLRALLIYLWSMLFIIPGIIAAYRYRMAKFLLLDDPSRGVTDCIRASKQMMYGHKWECFVLDLSFIGWWLLTAIPYVGYAVMVWTTPYINTTYVLYYMALAGKPVIVGPAPSEPTYM